MRQMHSVSDYNVFLIRTNIVYFIDGIWCHMFSLDDNLHHEIHQSCATIPVLKAASIFSVLLPFRTYCCTVVVLCAAGNLLDKRSPNLWHFMWWRVVCFKTEEPEGFGLDCCFKTVVKFQSYHRWYVSATPFTSELDSLRDVLQVILLNQSISQSQCLSSRASSRLVS